MKVFLLSYSPQPDKTVAAAARLCYSPAGAEQIAEAMDEERVRNFVQKLLRMGHDSPLEHASFTFAVEGVSRTLSHQMVRHRIASYSQKSQRYVSEDNFEYVTPSSIKNNPEARALFEAQMEKAREAYSALRKMVHQEDARYVLPNACETKYVVTMNARSLHHFFRLRMCRRAQEEIRQLAEMMCQEVKKVAPVLFQNAGPPCEVEGCCPEGDFSCGRLSQKNTGAEE